MSEMKIITGIKRTRGEKVFAVFNTLILTLLALLCFLPFWYEICVSFSSSSAILSKRVFLLPVDLSMEAYSYVMSRAPFWHALGITLGRVALCLPLGALESPLVVRRAEKTLRLLAPRPVAGLS